MRTSRSIAAAFALLAWTAAVRLPFAGTLGEDEVFYALVAQRWLMGLWPYAASFDVKPPGVFAVMAAVQAIFGTSVAVVKGLEVGCVGATSLGLLLIGVRYLSVPVGWIAAVLYPVYSLTLSGVDAPTALISGPFETFAVLAILSARGRLGPVFAAGVLLGGAGMVKQTAAFTAVALLGAILWGWRGRRWQAVVTYGLGLAVPPLGFAGLFLAAGLLPALITGSVLGAAGRLSGDNVSFLAGLARFFPGMMPLLVLSLGAVLVLTRGRALREGPAAEGRRVCLAWLLGGAIGVVATRSSYDHYFLVLVPPLLLLAGVAAVHLVRPPTKRLRAMVLVLAVALAVVWPVATGWRGLADGTEFAAARAAARVVQTAGLPPGAPILVVNRGMLVYLLANRQPGPLYFHPQHLMCDFPAPDADPLAVALAVHPGALVVADEGLGMVCERDDRWRELKAAIAAEYCPAVHATGTSDSYDVFVARSAGCR